MKFILAIGAILACAACAATPDQVKPEHISQYDYRESTCKELLSSIKSGREEEAKLVAQMNAWPTTGGGAFVRRVDLGRFLANVRGKIIAAEKVSARSNCAERLHYVG